MLMVSVLLRPGLLLQNVESAQMALSIMAFHFSLDTFPRSCLKFHHIKRLSCRQRLSQSDVGCVSNIIDL